MEFKVPWKNFPSIPEIDKQGHFFFPVNFLLFIYKDIENYIRTYDIWMKDWSIIPEFWILNFLIHATALIGGMM